MKVTVDKLDDAIERILDAYGEEVNGIVDEAIKNAAKTAKKELKQSSPKSTEGGPHYADGWSYRVNNTRLGIMGATIYNSKKPQLTHLLELGHLTKNGTGRIYPDTPAHPHILKVEEKVKMDFLDEVEYKLGF